MGPGPRMRALRGACHEARAMIVRCACAFCRRNGIPESRATLIPESATSYIAVAVIADAEPRGVGSVQLPSTQERFRHGCQGQGTLHPSQTAVGRGCPRPGDLRAHDPASSRQAPQGYVDKLNELVAGTRFADMP